MRPSWVYGHVYLFTYRDMNNTWGGKKNWNYEVNLKKRQKKDPTTPINSWRSDGDDGYGCDWMFRVSWSDVWLKRYRCTWIFKRIGMYTYDRCEVLSVGGGGELDAGWRWRGGGGGDDGVLKWKAWLQSLRPPASPTATSLLLDRYVCTVHM